MAAKPKAQAKQEKWVVEKTIDVEDNESTLSVHMDFKNEDGTFKIKTQLTTVQLSMNNQEITDGTLATLVVMVREAIDKAHALRAKKMKALGQEPLF